MMNCRDLKEMILREEEFPDQYYGLHTVLQFFLEIPASVQMFPPLC